jgi:hypothetical protein
MKIYRKISCAVFVSFMVVSIFASLGWAWSSDVMKNVKQADPQTCDRAYWRVYTVEGTIAVEEQVNQAGNAVLTVLFCQDKPAHRLTSSLR